jgi:hypothetical protein
MATESRPVPRAQEIYRHFKGNLYQIVAVAEHTETGEQLVVYQALYGENKIYCRPLEMFLSEVDHAKYPDVTQKYRFEVFGGAAGQVAAPAPAASAPVSDMAHVNAPAESSSAPEASEEPNLDPLILEFLETDDYQERLNILQGLRHRITDDMITTMAIACDVEVEENVDLEERVRSLKTCIETKLHYESDRLRERR